MTAAVLCTAACSGKKTARPGDASRDVEPPVLAGPPVTFRGIAKDREGTPLPDALIIAWPKGKRGEALAQGRTDEDGRFLLPGLRPGRWSLLVEAGGIGTLETERQVPEDGEA